MTPGQLVVWVEQFLQNMCDTSSERGVTVFRHLSSRRILFAARQVTHIELEIWRTKVALLLVMKVRLDYLEPMITIHPIPSHPIHPHIAVKTTSPLKIWFNQSNQSNQPNQSNQWPPMTSNDHQWPPIIYFWLYLASISGYFWLFMTISGYFWQFLAISVLDS